MLIEEFFINFEHKDGIGRNQINKKDICVFAQNHNELPVDFITHKFSNGLFLNKTIHDGLVRINHEKRSLNFILFPFAQDKAVIIIDEGTYITVKFSNT